MDDNTQTPAGSPQTLAARSPVETPAPIPRQKPRVAKVLIVIVVVVGALGGLLFAQGPRWTHPQFLARFDYKEAGWQKQVDGSDVEFFQVPKPPLEVEDEMKRYFVPKTPEWAEIGFVGGFAWSPPVKSGRDGIAVLVVPGTIKDLRIADVMDGENGGESKASTVVVIYSKDVSQWERIKFWLKRTL